MNNEKHSRVLIVDYMKVNRLILSELLKASGITSDMAESGQECIDLCNRNTYDLILLDHRMPELDGVDTLIQLNKIFESQGHQIPVVCHTTEDARNNTNLYKAAGFADVIFKPIQPKLLSEILMRYLPEGTVIDTEKKAEEIRIKQEIAKLPDWIRDADEINLYSAIEHCETAADYLDTLTIFVKSIEEKSGDIERYANENNLKMYTLRVHSLKSMSRLVGADTLADISSDLEIAGKHEDIDTITKYTHLLLEKYRSFLSLMPMLEEAQQDNTASANTPDLHLPEISAATLYDAYSSIKDFITCYDADSIQMVIDSLKEYHLAEDDMKKIDELENALSSLEWDRLRAVMNI